MNDDIYTFFLLTCFLPYIYWSNWFGMLVPPNKKVL